MHRISIGKLEEITYHKVSNIYNAKHVRANMY